MRMNRAKNNNISIQHSNYSKIGDGFKIHTYVFRKHFVIIIMLLLVSFIAGSCFSVKYSMSGASISPDLKTLSIQLFSDRSSSGQPTLGQQFTNALRDKCKAQTRLTIIPDGGESNFEGEITGFDVMPTAIQSNETAANNRLTLTVHVKFTNSIEPKYNFDTNFSSYRDYSSSESLNAAISDLMPKIIDELTENVFDKAFVNW